MPQRIYNTNAIQKVGIHPSVQEGEMAVPSILNGKRPAIVVPKSNLIQLAPPTLVGDFRIPDTITALPGVYQGAPNVNTIEYQWLINGVPVPGETRNTYDTTPDNHLDRLSCLITATSSISTISSVTATMTLFLYDPVTAAEFDGYVIIGMAVEGGQLAVETSAYFVTGIMPDAFHAIPEFEIYVINGM